MTTPLIAMTTMLLAGVSTGQVRPSSDFGTFVWHRCEPTLASFAAIGGAQDSVTPFATPRVVGTSFELDFDARADQV